MLRSVEHSEPPVCDGALISMNHRKRIPIENRRTKRERGIKLGHCLPSFRLLEAKTSSLDRLIGCTSSLGVGAFSELSAGSFQGGAFVFTGGSALDTWNATYPHSDSRRRNIRMEVFRCLFSVGLLETVCFSDILLAQLCTLLQGYCPNVSCFAMSFRCSLSFHTEPINWKTAPVLVKTLSILRHSRILLIYF